MKMRGDLEFASKITGGGGVQTQAERKVAWPGVANSFSCVRGMWALLCYSSVFFLQIFVMKSLKVHTIKNPKGWLCTTSLGLYTLLRQLLGQRTDHIEICSFWRLEFAVIQAQELHVCSFQVLCPDTKKTVLYFHLPTVPTLDLVLDTYLLIPISSH